MHRMDATRFMECLEKSVLPKRFAGPVDAAEISDFENKLGFSLPKQYRIFVSTYGCGYCGSLEIYGLGVPDNGLPHAGFVLRRLIELGTPLPRGLLPVSTSDEGDYLCILGKDTAGLPCGTVVSVIPGESAVRLAHASFGDFVMVTITDMTL